MEKLKADAIKDEIAEKELMIKASYKSIIGHERDARNEIGLHQKAIEKFMKEIAELQKMLKE